MMAMRSQYSASSMKCVVTITVTPLLGQRRDPPPEFAARQRIGAAGRLVEKQDFRLVQQCGGHRQPLLVAAGQLAAGSACDAAELELLQRPGDAFALAAAAQPIGAGEEVQVLDHGELAIERELLRHVADALPGRGAGVAQIDAGDAQRAAAGRQQTAEHAERGRLAGPVGPEQAEDLAAVDLEADMIDGGERAELPDEIVDLDDRFVSLSGPAAEPSVNDAATGCDPTAARSKTMKPSSNRGSVGTT